MLHGQRLQKRNPSLKLSMKLSIELHSNDFSLRNAVIFVLQLSDSDNNKRKFCPVGKLLPGVYVAIMDDDLKPLPVGVSGEV